MNEKLKVTYELSKEAVSGLIYLLGEELSDEQWQTLTKAPVPLNADSLGKQEKFGFELMLLSLAVLSVKAE